MSMYKVHIRNQGTYVSQTTSINNKLQVPSANWRSKKHQSMVPYVIKEVSIDIQYIVSIIFIYFLLSHTVSCQKILMLDW